jgi:hypothetical protein
MISLLFCLIAFGSELPGEAIFVAPSENSNGASPQTVSDNSMVKSKPRANPIANGNLPNEYLVGINRESTASELITPPKGSVEIFRGLKVGEAISVMVSHSVIAFPDEKSPVIASVENGSLRGFKFVGESYLEKNTKRIFLDFNRVVQGDRIYQLKAIGISSQGQPGLSGEYHSREAEYFAGDFASSFVAGYFDGLVPRKTNAFGQIETDSSVDSAVKKGLASGALSTADRFREKLKKVPEFSEIRGPFQIQLLILDQAKITQ